MVETKKTKRVTNLIIIIGILFAILFFSFPPLRDVIQIYAFGLILALVIYTRKAIEKKAFGFPKKTILPSAIFGIILGGIFYLITLFVPGLSFGIPLLPNTISDTLQAFVVLGIAPIIETILFQGALFSFFRTITKDLTANILQAITFALAHLGAYISGIYNLPNFNIAFVTLTANIGAFLTAFLFAFISGYFLLRSRRVGSNLIFVVAFHFIINLVVLFALSIAIVSR